MDERMLGLKAGSANPHLDPPQQIISCHARHAVVSDDQIHAHLLRQKVQRSTWLVQISFHTATTGNHQSKSLKRTTTQMGENQKNEPSQLIAASGST